MKSNLYSNLDEYDKEEDKIGMKIQKIKNNAAAPLQTTAEQLIRESQAHRTDDIKIPIQRISDEDEMNEYKLRKRKEFEDQIKRQRYHIGCWMKYAAWEEHQGEFIRARSVYERALQIDYRNTTIWLKYAEMEMKNKFVNHARNVWERACKYLPRVDQFWYKWAYMEEMLGNYIGARQIFMSWMTWEPEDLAWLAYAKFEERMDEIQNAREVLYKYIEVHSNLRAYLRVAKFEEKHGNKESSRRLFESALADLGNSALNEDFFIAFIRFEMRNKEHDRCRTLFKFGLEHIPKEKNQKLYKFYVKFEKMFGNKESIEDVILTKRRVFYEKEIEKNQLNYDIWFDYTRLEEQAATESDYTRVREIYERAITNVPPILEKKYWRRYIFLWINYAVFEESVAKNIDRANEVYKKAIEVIPHKNFTFTKVWILYAHFQLRNKNLDQARKIFGMSIGLYPREKIFKAYIELELQLGNIERCRTIYEKYIECQPDNSAAWVKYAELERSLDEKERCTAIYETAIAQPLDMPEVVWKAYINNEISYSDYDKVRLLYERLLDKTRHVKVWLSYAKFEQEIDEPLKSRKIFDRSYNYFKEKGMKEERLLILENWIKLEELLEDEEMLRNLIARKPEKIKKRRPIRKEGDESTMAIDYSAVPHTPEDHPEEFGWEEYYDYIFPDDIEAKKELKIISKALQWFKEKPGSTYLEK
jgi:crooked neck